MTGVLGPTAYVWMSFLQMVQILHISSGVECSPDVECDMINAEKKGKRGHGQLYRKTDRIQQGRFVPSNPKDEVENLCVNEDEEILLSQRKKLNVEG